MTSLIGPGIRFPTWPRVQSSFQQIALESSARHTWVPPVAWMPVAIATSEYGAGRPHWVKAVHGLPAWENVEKLRGFEAMCRMAKELGRSASRDLEQFKLHMCPHLFENVVSCHEYPCMYAHRYAFGYSPDTEESKSLPFERKFEWVLTVALKGKGKLSFLTMDGSL